ncbi:MAG TPA: EscU/YscU/HrcU family type III secretion system export apparatus switch protein [Gemmataceae bacterium]|nr:EscU/YscU/HrcU family type III secretion system export apparatus switch protein [Gemmataceae bacterium]
MDEKPKRPLQAVALRYAPREDEAPRLTAKGRGHIAEKIVELARRHGVPIRQDRNLVQVLSRLDLEQDIPPSVYRAVAEILAFVYRLSMERGGPQAGP